MRCPMALPLAMIAMIKLACAGPAPRTAAQEPESEAAERLKPLEPLVGEWVAETKIPDGTTVEWTISYRWFYDRKYLYAESESRVGDQSTRFNLVYLWDPA